MSNFTYDNMLEMRLNKCGILYFVLNIVYCILTQLVVIQIKAELSFLQMRSVGQQLLVSSF